MLPFSKPHDAENSPGLVIRPSRVFRWLHVTAGCPVSVRFWYRLAWPWPFEAPSEEQSTAWQAVLRRAVCAPAFVLNRTARLWASDASSPFPLPGTTSDVLLGAATPAGLSNASSAALQGIPTAQSKSRRNSLSSSFFTSLSSLQIQEPLQLFRQAVHCPLRVTRSSYTFA